MTAQSNPATAPFDEGNAGPNGQSAASTRSDAVAEEPRAPEQAGPGERYFNRELSQIAYHRRVMESAKDVSQPLLERLRSVAFFEDGLDEFFMTRVSALKEQVAAGVMERSPDGLTPRQELSEIRKALEPLYAEARNYLLDSLLPELRRQGISIEPFSALSPSERQRLARHFEQEVFPVCTPLAIDPGHPFPFISNRSVNLAVRLHDTEGRRRLADSRFPTCYRGT